MVGRSRTAQIWHAATAGLVGLALVIQLVVAAQGVNVLTPDSSTSPITRIWRFFSYFTVQSNILVVISASTLALDPDRDGLAWRVLRLAALLGITVTGLVSATLLAPFVHLTGLNWWLDKVLHVLSPIIVLIGWVIWGPRPRVDRRVIISTLAWPALWLVYTLIIGAILGWYPYPFLDHRRSGVSVVILSCLGITAMFVILAAVFRRLDLRPAPRRGPV